MSESTSSQGGESEPIYLNKAQSDDFIRDSLLQIQGMLAVLVKRQTTADAEAKGISYEAAALAIDAEAAQVEQGIINHLRERTATATGKAPTPDAQAPA